METKDDPTVYIVGVAIMGKGNLICSLPRPNRHHHVIKAMVGSGMKKPIIGMQGFILSNGAFVNREDAKVIATKAGQLLDRASKSSELFSECVW